MLRTIVFITIFACAVSMSGCGSSSDVKHLVNEGLVPAAKKSAKASVVNSGAQVTIRQNNLADMLGKRHIVFSGMGAGRKFIFVQFDNSRQERTVDKNGEITFLTPKDRKVKVTYIYGDYGLSKTFTLDQTKNYRWDSSAETFNPVQ